MLLLMISPPSRGSREAQSAQQESKVHLCDFFLKKIPLQEVTSNDRNRNPIDELLLTFVSCTL